MKITMSVISLVVLALPFVSNAATPESSDSRSNAAVEAGVASDEALFNLGSVKKTESAVIGESVVVTEVRSVLVARGEFECTQVRSQSKQEILSTRCTFEPIGTLQ